MAVDAKEVILGAEGLSIGYVQTKRKHKQLHANLNFSFYPGELVSLLGPNGAGKSTLFRTLGGFLPPLAGKVLLHEKNLKEYSVSSLAQQVSVVLTDRTISGGLTVYEMVSLGRYPHTGFLGTLQEKDHKVIRQSLAQVGITHMAENFVARLSDGERQKAMIAKALAQETSLILLDEPTAFLDLPSRIEIMVLLHRLAVEEGKCILLSTHDLDLALQFSDRLALLAQGKPFYMGAPEDLVLSGVFGAFFERENIVFNLKTGAFNPQLPAFADLYIQGADDNQLRWLSNALLRNRFKPIEGANPKGFTLVVSEEAESKYKVFYNGEELYNATNVESLLNCLNSFR